MAAGNPEATETGLEGRALVPYAGSYVQELRKVVGSRLLLVPGAQIVVIDDEHRVLLEREADYGRWALPAGACEQGATFASTAVTELNEETGLEVSEGSLVPFACLSDPAIHVLRYPNGDLTHCFALCFEARVWRGTPRPEPGEVTELGFFPADRLPSPLHPPTAVVLELHRKYRQSGAFQAR